MAPRGGAVKGAGGVRVSANGHKLPQRLPPDLILKDVSKKEWRLGKPVGVGGFGEIYLASDKINSPVPDDAAYVVKIEPHKNGPLFTEMHFYHRVGKHELIDEWTKKHRLDYLGMPRFFGSGSHDYHGEKYRFMVMERYGTDLQKVVDRSPGNALAPKTAFAVACRVIDVLEYIHSHGYIHADVKGSNLLLGFKRPQDRIYLVDFGLACRYLQSDSKHKEYKEDLRKAHDGTIEFTSRDAHIGAHSRRGDLEILGYNILQWLSGGRLPWMDKLKDPEEVAKQKVHYMGKLSELMNKCFGRKKVLPGVLEFMKYVGGLSFEDKPDYDLMRKILHQGMRAQGIKNDGLFELPSNIISPKANGKAPVKRGLVKKATSPNQRRAPKRKSMDAVSSVDEEDETEEEVDSEEDDQPSAVKRSKSAPKVTARGRIRSATPQSNGGATAKTGGRSTGRRGKTANGSTNSSTATSFTTTMSESSSCFLGLDNPTPAMLEVAMRKMNQGPHSNGLNRN